MPENGEDQKHKAVDQGSDDDGTKYAATRIWLIERIEYAIPWIILLVVGIFAIVLSMEIFAESMGVRKCGNWYFPLGQQQSLSADANSNEVKTLSNASDPHPNQADFCGEDADRVMLRQRASQYAEAVCDARIGPTPTDAEEVTASTWENYSDCLDTFKKHYVESYREKRESHGLVAGSAMSLFIVFVTYAFLLIIMLEIITYLRVEITGLHDRLAAKRDKERTPTESSIQGTDADEKKIAINQARRVCTLVVLGILASTRDLILTLDYSNEGNVTFERLILAVVILLLTVAYTLVNRNTGRITWSFPRFR